MPVPPKVPQSHRTAPVRILFYSGSIGLGHVTRDVAIARVIRRLQPNAEIHWFASSPAREYLVERGERLHPLSSQLADSTGEAELRARDDAFNITRWAVDVRERWAADGRLVLTAARENDYDVLVGDEAYDVAMALTGGAPGPGCPCFVLFDFLGLDRMSLHPVEWVGVEAINRAWAREPEDRYRPVLLGELEDIPLRRFGALGPRRRAWARRHCAVVGHVLPFDPKALPDRADLRTKLGYGSEPVVVVSVGGTGVGAGILDRCLGVFPQLRRELPDLRMILAGGPRLGASLADVPAGVEVYAYIPDLFEHLAACDLAIVQGGGATTLELTALQRPFLFFPLLGHSEQVKHVAARQRRLGAGVEMSLKRTTQRELCRAVISSIGREVHYPRVKTTGADELARMVIGVGEPGSG